jgi:hypothetical protein
MYSVLNEKGQLKLSYSSYVEYYEFQTFKSVSYALDTLTGKYYVSINFIANDKNNALRLYLSDINNQGNWTNDAVGAKQAVEDISSWIAAVMVPSFSGITRQAFTKRLSGSTDVVTNNVYSISFASVGTANAAISSDNGSTFSILKPGETMSFDAGDINNYFEDNQFHIDTTIVNAEVLVIYTY